MMKKKRISSKYKRIVNKGIRDWNKKSLSVSVNAYNKAADTMNTGGIDKFNAEQEKKYGKNYAQKAEYMKNYEKEFNRLLTQNLNEALNSFYETNKNVQRAHEFAEKYGMYTWSDLAKENKNNIEEVRSVIEKARK